MNWDTVLAALVVVAILGAAIGYIVRSKKRGVKCIGCPSGANCSGKCGGNCNCK